MASYQYSFLYTHLAASPLDFWQTEHAHSAEQQLALLGFVGVPVTDRPKSRLVVTEKALKSLKEKFNAKTQRRKDAKDFPSEINFDQSQIPNPKSQIVRPGLVHRLDKKTSGLILIAKTAHAHRVLSAHFERKLVEKKYLALVEGVVKEDAGKISAPIGRFEETKHWNIKTDGKPAETRFRVVERYADTTLLELQPVTGRTNQLRIHCEYIGHPIVGDERRGGREFRRLCLHAYKLAFQHPTEHRRLEFEIDLPLDFIWGK